MNIGVVAVCEGRRVVIAVLGMVGDVTEKHFSNLTSETLKLAVYLRVIGIFGSFPDTEDLTGILVGLAVKLRTGIGQKILP